MPRDVCYICGNKNRDVLEQHHIVPRRFGGSDDDENLVQLCANCHTSVERLYDKRFYDELGVSKPGAEEQKESHVCHRPNCTSEQTSRYANEWYEIWVCGSHDICSMPDCFESAEKMLPVVGDHPRLACHTHTFCDASGCRNSEDTIFVTSVSGEIYDVACREHAERRGFEI